MFITRGIEYIAAIAILPYLVRILGPDKFGEIMFAQGVMQYFIVFMDYGFNLSAPRLLAMNEDEEYRGRIFVAIMGAKTIIFIFCTIALFLIFSIGILKGKNGLFLGAYLLLIGNLVFPIWFFQGIQKMQYITLANIFARIILTISLLLYVKTEEDYIISAVLQSSSSLLAGIFSIFIIGKSYRHSICIPHFSDVKNMFKEGWMVFVSCFAMSIYSASNVIVLGLLFNSKIVGYYSSIEKIIKAVTGIIHPISIAVYPYSSKAFLKEKNEMFTFFKKLSFFIIGTFFLISLMIFCFSEDIVWLLLGKEYTPGIKALQIMAFLPMVISVSNILGIQILLAKGLKDVFGRIVTMGAVFNMVIIYPLSAQEGIEGASFSVFTTELVITLLMLYKVYKLRLYIWR